MSPRFGLPRRTAVGPAAAGLTESVEPNVADSAEPIEVTPGDAADEVPAGEAPAGDAAGVAGLVGLSEYRRAVLSWVAEDAYPVNVDVEIEVKPGEGVVRFSEPPGFKVAPGSIVGITGSHVHPLPDGGFDERRHVTVWGVATARPRGRFVVKPDRVWAWDERDLPLPAAYERSLPRARRYFEALSVERGVQVRPRLSTGLLLFRATRAPFLSATFVPLSLIHISEPTRPY